MDVDFLLIQRMLMGDENAIDRFVQKYYRQILNYCRFHVEDNGYAEDMTQETFIRFFRSFQQYQHYGKAANYLYVIAANVCHDFYKRTKEVLVAELPEETCIAEEPVEERMDVHMAIASLPEEIREVAVLYFLQEKKQKDIAKILKIGLPLVKYRISRAREILTECLREEEQ